MRYGLTFSKHFLDFLPSKDGRINVEKIIKMIPRQRDSFNPGQGNLSHRTSEGELLV